ncbi:hypothetical protein D3C71_1789480 [compost metagenome]
MTWSTACISSAVSVRNSGVEDIATGSNGRENRAILADKAAVLPWQTRLPRSVDKNIDIYQALAYIFAFFAHTARKKEY